MQATQVLAGYTLGGADLLRRAMGKKKVEEMQKQRDTFVKGCAKTNHIAAGKANQIFDLLEKFAGYGFNKSHAAAYAIVAYQTAYLKANYPVEFLSAMMTNDMSDIKKLGEFINEARVRCRCIEVLPPDVNESQLLFAPARGGKVIRFGMAAIKGVGEVAVQSILAARKEAGEFTSLGDMCERVDIRTVNRRVLEALIKSGGCDTAFKENARDVVFAELTATLSRASGIIQDRQRGQSSMFGMLEEKSGGEAGDGGEAAGVGRSTNCSRRKKSCPLGFYVTGHPLTPFAPLLKKYALANTAGLVGLANRSLTRIGGLIAAVQLGVSKKSNKPYAMSIDAGGFGRLGANPVHERELRQISQPVCHEQGDPGGGRGQQRRGQAEDFSAGNHAAGRRAAQIHQAGAFPAAHGACAAATNRERAGTGAGASRQMPAIPVFHAAGGGKHFLWRRTKSFCVAPSMQFATGGGG